MSITIPKRFKKDPDHVYKAEYCGGVDLYDMCNSTFFLYNKKYKDISPLYESQADADTFIERLKQTQQYVKDLVDLYLLHYKENYPNWDYEGNFVNIQDTYCECSCPSKVRITLIFSRLKTEKEIDRARKSKEQKAARATERKQKKEKKEKALLAKLKAKYDDH